MKEILSNPLYAFGSLGVCVFIGWIIFVKLFPLTALQWKKSDYLWLSLSAIGLFGLLANNRILFSQNELEICKARIELYLKATKSDMSNQYFCKKFTKSEYSPENFDEVQKEFDIMCEWKETNFLRIDSMLNGQIIVNISELAIPNVKTESLIESIYYLTHNIEQYNYYITQKQILTNKIKYYDFEDMFRIFSPLLLIIGLSIRFTKTLGEINLQKKKNK
jgi:hypothetical protein